MRRILATGFRVFETVYRPLFKRQAVRRPPKKGSVISSETPATTFPPTPYNIPEERSPLIQGDQKSLYTCFLYCNHKVHRDFLIILD